MPWAQARRNADRTARTRREMSLGLSPQGCIKPGPPGAERRWDRSGEAPDGTGRLCTEAGASGPIGLRSQGRRRDGPEDGPARDRPRPRRDRGQGLFAEAGAAEQPRNAKRAGRRRTAGSGERPALRKAALTRDGGACPLAGDAGRGGQMAAHSPWGSGPSSSRTSDGSCGSGVRPAPEASGGVLPGTRAVLFPGDRAT